MFMLRSTCLYFLLILSIFSNFLLIVDKHINIKWKEDFTTTTTVTMEEVKHNNNNLSHSSIILDDFDLSAEKLPCGFKKCFFLSKTNQDIGYLMKGRKVFDKNNISSVHKGYELSQWIDRHFNDDLHHHFYIDKPFMVNLNETIREELNKRIKGRNQTKIFTTPSAAVQKVKKTKINEMIMFQCSFKTVKKRWAIFMKKAIQKKDGAKYLKNMEKSYNILEETITLKPTILNDFQAYFDREGNIYFTDLDGSGIQFGGNVGQEKRTNTKRMECLKTMEQIVNNIRKMV